MLWPSGLSSCFDDNSLEEAEVKRRLEIWVDFIWGNISPIKCMGKETVSISGDYTGTPRQKSGNVGGP